MTVHAIMLPEGHNGPTRSIVWDDEAGTVTGEHSDVPRMQEVLAAPKPWVCGDVMGTLILHDPGHDPADFLVLLGLAYWPVLREPLRSALPPVFHGVEPTPMKHPPPSLDADGNPVPVLY